MSQKNPAEYCYGTPCKDHLGNEYINAKEMCDAYNIPYETYQSRKRNKWDIERILTTPPRNYIWHTPTRNMGIPQSKKEQKKYKNYREKPGTRLVMGYDELKKYHGRTVTVEADNGKIFTGFCDVYSDIDDENKLYYYINVGDTYLEPEEIISISCI